MNKFISFSNEINFFFFRCGGPYDETFRLRFVLKMMEFVLKMMEFVLKMITSVFTETAARL